MGAKIPMNTLHAKIHAKVHDVPVPKEPVCRATVQELGDRIARGEIDVKRDTLEQRLDFLIEYWGELDGMEATLAMLKWQRQIVHKFYYGSSS